VTGEKSSITWTTGVGPHSGDDEIKYHKYYQWVFFFLCAQALAFYFPRFLWKNMEGGKMKMLVQDLQVRPQDPIVQNFSTKITTFAQVQSVGKCLLQFGMKFLALFWNSSWSWTPQQFII